MCVRVGGAELDERVSLSDTRAGFDVDFRDDTVDLESEFEIVLRSGDAFEAGLGARERRLCKAGEKGQDDAASGSHGARISSVRG